MKFIAPAQDVSKLGFFSSSKPQLVTIGDLVKACKDCRAGIESKTDSGSFQTTPVQGYFGNYLYLTKLRYYKDAINVSSDLNVFRSLCASVNGAVSNHDATYSMIDGTENLSPMPINGSSLPGLILPIPSKLLDYTAANNASWLLPQVTAYVSSAGIQSGGGAAIYQKQSAYSPANYSSQTLTTLSYSYNTERVSIYGYIQGRTVGYDFTSTGYGFGRVNNEPRLGVPSYSDTTTVRVPRVSATGAPDESVDLDYYFIPVNINDSELKVMVLQRGVDYSLASGAQPSLRANGTQLKDIRAFDPLILNL